MSGFRRRTRPDAFDEVGLTIPLDVLSSNLKPDRQTLLEILSGLSRDDTLLMCARLNTVVSGLNAEFTNGQQRALAFICNDEEIKKIGDFAKQHGGEARVVPFFRGQLLELIRYVAKYCGNLPDDGNTFQDPEVRSRFVKAALIAAQLWSDRVYGTRLSDHENVEVARVRTLGAFRKGVEESNAAPFIGQLLGRGVFLFLTYFPLRYPNFHDEFVTASRLTPEEFFNCTAAMSFLTISDRSGSPIFNREGMGTRTAYRELIPKYLKMESQDPEALRQSLWTNFEQIGSRAIRERPILSLEDGRSIIIDPTFFNEKLSVGLLFALLRNAEKSKANEIFGAFGLAFEDYAIDILKRMYPHTGTLARRFSWNIKGRDQNGRALEIDAVVNDVKQIVVFEMKAAWLQTVISWVESLRTQWVEMASRNW
jgi:hypothetical protein